MTLLPAIVVRGVLVLHPITRFGFYSWFRWTQTTGDRRVMVLEVLLPGRVLRIGSHQPVKSAGNDEIEELPFPESAARIRSSYPKALCPQRFLHHQRQRLDA
jgi:hypothetical protein